MFINSSGLFYYYQSFHSSAGTTSSGENNKQEFKYIYEPNSLYIYVYKVNCKSCYTLQKFMAKIKLNYHWFKYLFLILFSNYCLFLNVPEPIVNYFINGRRKYRCV